MTIEFLAIIFRHITDCVYALYDTLRLQCIVHIRMCGCKKKKQNKFLNTIIVIDWKQSEINNKVNCLKRHNYSKAYRFTENMKQQAGKQNKDATKTYRQTIKRV